MKKVSAVRSLSSIKIGSTIIGLNRTVRVNPEDVSSLPPSLGKFEVYKTSDFRETCPETWENDSFFIAMHDIEAMWMSFSSYLEPSAILIGAGGINVLNAHPLNKFLEKDSYLVSPPQPWLDGFKNEEGSVYQFVAAQYKDGDGKSVGEQILGHESKHGGLEFSIYELNEEKKKEITKQRRKELSFGSLESFSTGTAEYCSKGELDMLHAFAQETPCSEMGLGKGGKIEQKVYPDPFGLECWEEVPKCRFSVYLINGPMFQEITGMPLPPLPPSFDSYKGVWFKMDDSHLKDVSGTKAFNELDSI